MKWVKRIFLLIVVLLLIGAGTIAYFIFRPPTPIPLTPAGHPQLQALYIEMTDGTKIAADIWLPEDLTSDQKIPGLIRATRYWRAMAMRDTSMRADMNYAEAKAVTEAGYALILVDTRGSGASFGTRPYEMNEQEMRDLGEVTEWINQQPWSNNRVGAYGVSFDGNTAEMLLINEHPAVMATAPLYNDWNWINHLIMPGGVKLNFFLEEWGQLVAAMDRNDMCALAGVEGVPCDLVSFFVHGVKPVDGEALPQAVADHVDNMKVFEAVNHWEFHDDDFGTLAINDVYYRSTPAGYLDELQRNQVPFYVPVGWLDAATVSGAIARYQTLSNPQQVIIGPWSHGGTYHVDPFLPADTPTDPPTEEQDAQRLAFFDRYLKENGEPLTESSITYYTLGAGTWNTTTTWPPEGTTQQTFFLSDSAALSDQPPNSDASDTYEVDFTATTGATNRWRTNAEGSDVIYPDRRTEDEKLLTYTTAPIEEDITVTGSPILTLHLQSSAEDGAIFAYLEDVAPDGTVTYITEGQLRLQCRNVSEDEPPFAFAGPYRTFTRADSMAMSPDAVEEITFDLWPTSVLFKKGHRIRIAIAGADSDSFQRYPTEGDTTWTIHRSTTHPSKLTLPTQP